ncbi:hypothetical protein MNBD_CHLOROFLEXI01-4937 [hydrothermal vent metagenome]|uniref:Uncharacterized protein n=1 Tax=hydrothermal vent metagenome TaxID=652676 RepID=A0A3B0UQR7_9ZZZZ
MRKDYQAYLLRFQRSDGQPNWRVRLENGLNGEVKQFATEREAFHYLIQMLNINSQLQSGLRELDRGKNL